MTTNVATVLSKAFGKTSPLEQMMRSSIETKLEGVRTSIEEQTGFRVAATFDEHAICTDNDGKFFRIGYSTGDGGVEITLKEEIEGWKPVFADLLSETRAALGSAVDAILAESDFDISPIMMSFHSNRQVVKQLSFDLISEAAQKTRWWKIYLSESEEAVHEMLRGKFEELTDKYPASKWVDVQIDEDAVVVDINGVRASLVELQEAAKKADTLVSESKIEQSSQSTSFARLSRELQEDLDTAVALVDNVTSAPVKVEQVARAYELLAALAPDFFVGTELVCELAKNLVAPVDGGEG